MAYGTVNADLMTTSDGVSSSGLYGFKNRIINGAMVFDQRNAGASVTPTDGGYVTDRFKYTLTQASKLTAQQSTTSTTGFVNSLLTTSSSAYSITSSDVFILIQNIEGFNVADLAWGSASAATVTLSFWVRSSLTGTFGGSVANSARNRSYPFTYTISTANTFEQKTITISGDTTGTWVTNNGEGIRLSFGLGVGSTFSGTAGAWAAADYRSATSATSVVGTNGATFYITGVQLEKGSTATSFDYRPYSAELAMCQRYYQKFNGSQYLNEGVGAAAATTIIYYNKPFITSMRTAPTFSSSGNFNADGTSYSALTLTMPYASTETARIDGTGSGFTAGQAYGLTHQSTDSYLQFSAEL